MTPAWRLLAAVASVSAGCLACGGPSTPTAPPTPVPTPSALPAGTTWNIASGIDGQPLAGSRVVVGDQSYVTDASGAVTLAAPAPFGSPLEIVADGFLERQTLVRRSGPGLFLLWPRVCYAWSSEEYVKKLVYTAGSSDPPPDGSSPLRRLRRGTTQAVLVLSQELFDDPESHVQHAFAVDIVNAAVRGRVVYSLATALPTSGVAFDVSVNPADPLCTDRVLGIAQTNSVNGEITGGRIVYCSSYAAHGTTVAHEVGHTFGLQHSPNRSELMYAYSLRAQAGDFGAGEILTMNMLLERPGGQAFPDDDRGLTLSGSSRVTHICR